MQGGGEGVVLVKGWCGGGDGGWGGGRGWGEGIS
jgi:hypothetical protein